MGSPNQTSLVQIFQVVADCDFRGFKATAEIDYRDLALLFKQLQNLGPSF
jgi:hypothetical protein